MSDDDPADAPSDASSDKPDAAGSAPAAAEPPRRETVGLTPVELLVETGPVGFGLGGPGVETQAGGYRAPDDPPLTEAEAAEIDAAFAALKGDLDRLSPTRHAELLQPIAPEYAEAFQDAELAKLAEIYGPENRSAIRAQSTHFRTGRLLAVAAAIAVLMTLPQIMLGDGADARLAQRAAVALQGLFVLIGAIASLYVFIAQPRRRWLAARSAAEAARRAYFRRAAMLALTLPASRAAYLRLAFFDRFHRQTQRDYYALKQPAAAARASATRRWYFLGLALSALAAIPGVAESVALVLGIEAGDAQAEGLAGALARFGAGSAYFAASGVFATALLGFVAAMAALDISRRNAEQYARNIERLDALADAPLARARDAARHGDQRAVEAFAASVDAALAEEQGEWEVIGRTRETA